jgi:hypothetical protein
LGGNDKKRHFDLTCSVIQGRIGKKRQPKKNGARGAVCCKAIEPHKLISCPA